jgi:prepilin-type processing-associated H-X9-DG protein
MSMPRSFIVALFLLILSAGGAWAQPLADRVPSDALLYIGWAGSDKLGPAYAASHLKGVLDSSQIPELFSDLGPKFIRHLQLQQMLQGDPVVRELVPSLLTVGGTTWSKPTALYVGPVDYSGKVPLPKVALLCDAGKDAQAFSDAATKLIEQIPPEAPFKIRVKVLPGDVVIVSSFDLPARIEESLSQRDAFKNAIKQGRPDAAFTAYFDAEKVINVASMAINLAGDDKATGLWQRMLFTTGLGGVKRILYTAGFDGRDWGTQAFIEAPAPRVGLLATLLDAKPVSDDLLKLAPQSSNWVMATRLDLAHVMRDVRNGLARIDPQMSKDFEQGLKVVSDALGINIQKDLFGALGDQWLAYNSDQTGHGLLGMSIVNPLRDAATLEKTLTGLEKQANAFLSHEAETGGPTFSIETTKIGDLNVHYFPVPALAPCWTIRNNTFYFALFPQILAGAAQPEANGKSILDNEDFIAARQRLNLGTPAVSLSYMDLPRLAPRGYQMVLALQRTALGFSDMFGLQTPAMVLPPLYKIKPHLAPSLAASWVDDTGWHYRDVSPFPGAGLLGGEQSLATVVVPGLAAVALPAVANARRQAMMMQNMSNLRQIGVATIMYANENKGNLPPDLGATLQYTNSPMLYLAPDHQQQMRMPANAKPADLAKWVNEHSDYVYIGKRLGKLSKIARPAETIIAHEKLETTSSGLVNILYADGHVELVPLPSAKERVEKQQNAAPDKN